MFRKSQNYKIIAIVLAIIFFQSGIEIHADDVDHNKTLSILKEKYNSGDYEDIIPELENLLNVTCEEFRMIRGELFLLLGASLEQTGKKEEAIENYLLGDLLLDKPEIEGVDLNSLKVYRGTLFGNVISGRRVFEKVGKRKTKKKFPYFAILGVAAITVAVLVLFKKKVKEVPENISKDYAEEVFSEIEWIEIPAGEFLMGDNVGTGDYDESPIHNVYLDSYKISKYEITYGQYSKFDKVNKNVRATFGGRGDDYPVTSINLEEARQFCLWLTEMNNKSIKIPTEAQWEKAARGTDQRIYPWGNYFPDCTIANYNNCSGNTSLVGSHPEDRSYYGVMDMGGNVTEWVFDWYSEDYYSISPHSNPTGADSNDTNYRIVRGADFRSSDCRASNRTPVFHNYGRDTYGFRIVMLN